MLKSFSFKLMLVQIFFVIGICLLSNCTTSKSANSSKNRIGDANLIQPKENESDVATWTSLFRQVPGIDVRGANEDLTLIIRGSASMQGNNSPLFVLEGVPLGHDFSSLASSILPKDVASIRVLKGASASIYGVRAANGVVVVKGKE